jgi:hypothetical protein
MELSEEQRQAMAELAEAEAAVERARAKLLVVKGPTHIDGIRDPDAPCASFRTGTPEGDCETDGHYVCDDCVHRATCDGCGKRPSHCECQPPEE